MHEIMNTTISAATIVGPTGALVSTAIIIPAKAHTTEITAEEIITLRKLPNILIADKAGHIISADMRSEPTRFIASTIITAVITAIMRLYTDARVPVAQANVSSNVTENILLYSSKNAPITRIDIITQIHTSAEESVSIDVPPNNVLHTSPDILAEEENVLKSRYPIARAPTEISAIAASPLIFVFRPVISSRIALTTVIGKTIIISLDIPRTPDIANAPNATCESPSPMNENRLSTRVTPSSDEHSAISSPTSSAYLTNGYEK